MVKCPGCSLEQQLATDLEQVSLKKHKSSFHPDMNKLSLDPESPELPKRKGLFGGIQEMDEIIMRIQKHNLGEGS